MVMRLMGITAAPAELIKLMPPSPRKEIHNCIKKVCRTRRENYRKAGIVRIKEKGYKIKTARFWIYFETDSKEYINIIDIKRAK